MYTVEQYSEKSFAVFGDMSMIGPICEKLGSSCNSKLRDPAGGVRSGYVFPNFRRKEVEKALGGDTVATPTIKSVFKKRELAKAPPEEDEPQQQEKDDDSELQVLRAENDMLQEKLEKQTSELQRVVREFEQMRLTLATLGSRLDSVETDVAACCKMSVAQVKPIIADPSSVVQLSLKTTRPKTASAKRIIKKTESSDEEDEVKEAPSSYFKKGK